MEDSSEGSKIAEVDVGNTKIGEGVAGEKWKTVTEFREP